MLLKIEVMWDVMVCHGVSSLQKGCVKNIGNHRPTDKSRTFHNTSNISNKALRTSGLASNISNFKYQVTLY